MISQARFHALDARQQAALHGLLHAGWPMDKALAILAGRPPPQVGGARKYDDALSGYYKGMSDEHKAYLTQLFYRRVTLKLYLASRLPPDRLLSPLAP